METMDLFEAKEARDRGISSVMENAGDWTTKARAAVEALPTGWRGTGEQLRLTLVNNGLPKPHHHNAWGGLVRGCIPRFLVPTGEVRAMETRKSHARKTDVYRRVA